jgi:hypothetical protein
MAFQQHGNLQFTKVFSPAMAERKNCENLIAKVKKELRTSSYQILTDVRQMTAGDASGAASW